MCHIKTHKALDKANINLSEEHIFIIVPDLFNSRDDRRLVLLSSQHELGEE